MVDVIQANVTYTNIQDMQDETGNVSLIYSEIQDEFRGTIHDNLRRKPAKTFSNLNIYAWCYLIVSHRRCVRKTSNSFKRFF